MCVHLLETKSSLCRKFAAAGYYCRTYATIAHDCASFVAIQATYGIPKNWLNLFIAHGLVCSAQEILDAR